MSDEFRKSYFPSIESPVRQKNSAQMLISKRNASPYNSTKKSVNEQEKAVKHFLLKYLERKEIYENRYNYQAEDVSFTMRDKHGIDPKFRRVYTRKIRQVKKYPQCKFIIGVID